MAGEATTDGTLFQGSDGAVYFIPDSELARFRLPAAVEQCARDGLAEMEGDVGGFSQGAVSVNSPQSGNLTLTQPQIQTVFRLQAPTTFP